MIARAREEVGEKRPCGGVEIEMMQRRNDFGFAYQWDSPRFGDTVGVDPFTFGRDGYASEDSVSLVTDQEVFFWFNYLKACYFSVLLLFL